MGSPHVPINGFGNADDGNAAVLVPFMGDAKTAIPANDNDPRQPQLVNGPIHGILQGKGGFLRFGFGGVSVDAAQNAAALANHSV